MMVEEMISESLMLDSSFVDMGGSDEAGANKKQNRRGSWGDLWYTETPRK